MADPEPVTPAHPQSAVVSLLGEIDPNNARQVRQRLYAALAAGAPVVVADLTATTFCDSTGRPPTCTNRASLTVCKAMAHHASGPPDRRGCLPHAPARGRAI